jgi:hypothetical protein
MAFVPNDSDRPKAIRVGAVPVLIGLLDLAHIRLQSAIVCTLANILDISSYRSKAAGPGFTMDGTIVSAPGHLLASSHNNAGVQKRAISALTQTKLCPVLPPTDYEDAIHRVVPLLASTNVHIQIHTIIMISSIADCEEHRATAVNANAIPLLVNLLGSIGIDTPWSVWTLDHLVLRSVVAAIHWIMQDPEPARRVAHDDAAVWALIRLLATQDIFIVVDAAYVLKHVVVLAGSSTGVVREAVPVLEATLCRFRYSGHVVSVVRDAPAGPWQPEESDMMI